MLVDAAAKMPRANWLLHPSVLPAAGAICRLMRPIIRPDHRRAYVGYLISTRWWGARRHERVDKDPVTGRWRAAGSLRLDFTDWTDGQMVFEQSERCFRHSERER
jgi:hypothetical protein